MSLLPGLYPVELLVLAAAVLVGLVLLYRIGFSTNLGLLTTGIVVGSVELSVLFQEDLMHGLAELGALFLLFVASARCRYRIVSSRLQDMQFAALYVLLAVAAAGILLRLVGLPWRESVFTGLLLAFTCTPTTIQMFAASPGRKPGLRDAAIMIQIVLVLLVLSAVPLLSSNGAEPREALRTCLVGMPLIIIAFILAGRWFPETVARIERTNTKEAAFTKITAIIGLPLVFSYIIGLPLAFGAVTSGILVSETRLGGASIGEVVSLRWVVAGLFLVPLGMLFDHNILIDQLLLLGGTITGVVLLKLTFVAGAAVLLYRSLQIGFQPAVHLLPIGALSFLIFAEGRSYGLVPGGWQSGGEQLFIAVTVLLFVLYALTTAVINRRQSWRKYAVPALRWPVGKRPLKQPLLQKYRSADETVSFPNNQVRRSIPRRGYFFPRLNFDRDEQPLPVLTREGSIYLWEIQVESGAPVDGRTLEEVYRHPRFNLVLVGLWRTDICYSDPPPTLQLQTDDRLIVSGTPGQYIDGGVLFSRPQGSGAGSWLSHFGR